MSAAGMLFLPNPTESRGKWKEGWGQGGERRGGEGSTRRVKEGGWGQEKGMVEVRKMERGGAEGPGKGWKGWGRGLDGFSQAVLTLADNSWHKWVIPACGL